jgi:hypothetical protein
MTKKSRQFAPKKKLFLFLAGLLFLIVLMFSISPIKLNIQKKESQTSLQKNFISEQCNNCLNYTKRLTSQYLQSSLHSSGYFLPSEIEEVKDNDVIGLHCNDSATKCITDNDLIIIMQTKQSNLNAQLFDKNGRLLSEIENWNQGDESCNINNYRIPYFPILFKKSVSLFSTTYQAYYLCSFHWKIFKLDFGNSSSQVTQKELWN